MATVEEENRTADVSPLSDPGSESDMNQCVQEARILVGSLNRVFQKLGSLGVQSRIDILMMHPISRVVSLDVPLLQVEFLKKL